MTITLDKITLKSFFQLPIQGSFQIFKKANDRKCPWSDSVLQFKENIDKHWYKLTCKAITLLKDTFSMSVGTYSIFLANIPIKADIFY